jgi:hypothetical protein
LAFQTFTGADELKARMEQKTEPHDPAPPRPRVISRELVARVEVTEVEISLFRT